MYSIAKSKILSSSSVGSVRSDESKSPVETIKRVGRLVADACKQIFITLPSQEELSARIDKSACRGCISLIQNRELQKIQRARNRLRVVGSPKNSVSPNQEDEDLIARTAMRHPSKDAIKMLKDLHEELRIHLGEESLDGLSWLLRGSSMNARGGFVDAVSLQKFLSQSPQTISSSRLITGLNTILTAIIYRDNSYSIEDSRIKTQNVKQMMGFIKGGYPDCYEVLGYEASYPDSRMSALGREGNFSKILDAKDYFKAEATRAELSDASDMEEDLPKQKRIREEYFLHKNYNGTSPTWMSSAKASGVPIRAGISGTALSCLEKIEWLFGFPSRRCLFQEDLRSLAGILIVAPMLRGDYHSIAETSAAIQHYMAHRPGGDTSSAFLSPQEVYRKGLELMVKSSDEQYREDMYIIIESIMNKIN
jgi:hypothetical protein